MADKIAPIEFFIGTYKDSAEFDIIPMQSCHLLFRQPWISENNVVHIQLLINILSNTMVEKLLSYL